jgi:MFS family permease
MRRLLLLVSAIVLVDTMFYAAITPLLPHYSDELGLSKAEAGVLTAAYPAGTLLGSLPSGWLALRVGARRTVLLGLGSLAVSSLVFGLGESLAVLVAARFVQGLGGAASWTGALAWLVAAGPPDRRGELIGTAFGAAVGGALLGPLLGVLANETSPEATFGAVAALATGLLVATLATAPPPKRPATPGGFTRALRERPVRAGMALVVLVGLFFGVLEVLVPLRLDELGASAAIVAGTFLAGAALQALASPVAGRYLDRRGPLPLVRVALLAAVATALVVPALQATGPLVVLAIAAGPLVGMLWVPGMKVLSDGTDAAGLDQALAFALVNLTWAGAQTAGAGGGGALADAAGDWAAYGAVAGVMAAALAVALSAKAPSSGPRASGATPSASASPSVRGPRRPS